MGKFHDVSFTTSEKVWWEKKENKLSVKYNGLHTLAMLERATMFSWKTVEQFTNKCTILHLTISGMHAPCVHLALRPCVWAHYRQVRRWVLLCCSCHTHVCTYIYNTYMFTAHGVYVVCYHTVKLLINAPGVYSNNRQIPKRLMETRRLFKQSANTPRRLVESRRERVVVVRVESNWVE